MKTQITLQGFVLEVEYAYYQGSPGSRLDPPEPEGVEIDEIIMNEPGDLLELYRSFPTEDHLLAAVAAETLRLVRGEQEAEQDRFDALAEDLLRGRREES